ncbi:Copper(Cu+)exporting P-ATPase [Bifidobacterium magnum]|uniref:Copper(Cu+)exporting P-ATPase n=1 Tax=Bifidobacterium magnum TaxID=1692 RepID=A0A087BET1_9BIFI|nr:copper-exporting ATPase [Bifidobacterium magnum]KFI69531.1 Copper(Cu+)exporting P-ATPase [Bifidobacterium magnum]
MGLHIFFTVVALLIAIVLTLCALQFFFPSRPQAPSHTHPDADQTSPAVMSSLQPIAHLTGRTIVAAILCLVLLVPAVHNFAANSRAKAWLVNPWLQAAIATPVMFYSASPIHVIGWKALVNRTPNMMSLASIGLIGSYAYSLLDCLFPRLLAWNDNQTYFAFVGVITTLVLLAQLITDRWMSHRRKLPAQRMVDRVTVIFVPVVLIIALWTFTLWLAFGPQPALPTAVLCAISVLIIACPCALGWAMPLSISFALQRAHRDGMRIVHLNVLQRAQYIRSVVFSNTIATEAKSAMIALNKAGIRTSVLDVHSISALATAANQIDSLRSTKNRVALVAFVSTGLEAESIRNAVDISVIYTDNIDDYHPTEADLLCNPSTHSHILSLIQLSHATMRNVRQNLAWTFIFNIIGIPLAAGLLYPFTGWLLNPMLACAAMLLSSVLVLLNALRLRRRSTPRPSSRRPRR